MKVLTYVIVTLFIITPVLGQNSFPYDKDPSYFNGGLGITYIDGVPFTTISISPEFTFGKFGLGLRIELLFDNQNNFKFRTEGWNDARALTRAIRYARYGHKGDTFYTRIGSLVAATLGHGFLMWYYSNEVNYDQRKFGAILDLDFTHVGFESMVNDFGNIEVYGGRLYIRPIKIFDIPVLSDLEFGGTFVTDNNPDANSDTKDGITEWGIDVGLPLIRTEMFKTILYFDYAKFVDFGEGRAVGVNFGFPNIVNLVSIDVRFERRWLGDKFIPNYFNTLYELERSLPNGLDKRSRLAELTKSSGYFGELAGNIAGIVRLVGSYQQQDGIPYSGIIHLEASLMDLIPNVRFLAYYDKTNIETFEDARTLDVFSQAIAELGYVTYGILMISLRYRWNFIEVSPGHFQPQERFEPRISLVYDF